MYLLISSFTIFTIFIHCKHIFLSGSKSGNTEPNGYFDDKYIVSIKSISSSVIFKNILFCFSISFRDNIL